MRFKFSTHGQLYKTGMTMVEAYNEAGEQILFAAGNFLNIWDDTFTEFTCNEAYIPDHDETLTIRLYNESAWDGPLGVWASEGEVSGMPLSVTDGDTLNATMAMQRVSDFTGSWPAALAAGCKSRWPLPSLSRCCWPCCTRHSTCLCLRWAWPWA